MVSRSFQACLSLPHSLLLRRGSPISRLHLPKLHWMQKEKLIEAEWCEAETGRRRKYYRIRKEGRAALGAEREQWLTVHQTLNHLWKIKPRLT